MLLFESGIELDMFKTSGIDSVDAFFIHISTYFLLSFSEKQNISIIVFFTLVSQLKSIKGMEKINKNAVNSDIK